MKRKAQIQYRKSKSRNYSSGSQLSLKRLVLLRPGSVLLRPMKFWRQYIHTYSGLSKPAWMLALVLLINRSGAMVLPFLSIYLKDELRFTPDHVGIVLALFGLGSLLGSYLGGWLSDKIGTFWVQFYALILAGVGFIMLSHVTEFHAVAAGFFFLTTISESFRPANTAAVAKHAKPENLTRAYSLNRMAINLGFAVGPALGGFLAHIGYDWLFYVNAGSAFLSAIVFASYFFKKRNVAGPVKIHPSDERKRKSPFRDLKFVFILLLTVGFGITFFQLIFTLPVYYREHYLLSEYAIGWLLGFNGILVFLLEMPLVYIAGKWFSLNRIVAGGCVLLGASYFVLGTGEGVAVLIIAMVLLSISEILVMPFLTTFSANRGGEYSRGNYLGAYSMSYSIAFIVAPPLAYAIITRWSYSLLWILLAILVLLVAIGFIFMLDHKRTTPKIIEEMEAVPE